MNPRILSAFLLTAVLSLSGCIINGGGGSGGGGGGTCTTCTTPKQPGDVTFTWSFAGAECNQVPNVKSVWIQIPGESLQNNGVFPCLANNYPGIVLHNFAPGSYTFTIEANGYSNEKLFVGSGAFTVNGNVRVNVDLTPAGGPSSYAYMAWSFPPNSMTNGGAANCTQAGVAFVDAYFDGDNTAVRYTCTKGETSGGAVTPYLAPGHHTVTLIGLTSGQYPMYRRDSTFDTFAGNPISAAYSMQWAVGGVALKWTLTNGSTTYSGCGAAGVTDMQVNFQDSQGNMVYGTSWDAQKCDAAPVIYSYLQPGTYRVYVQGTGPGVTFKSNFQNAPVIQVNAGVFPGASQAINVTMYKQ
jgi:hypothetical protein